MTRTIEVSVFDEYMMGDGVVIGAAGAAGHAKLRMTFSGGWLDVSKTVLFRDALEQETAEVLILPAMQVETEQEDTEVYDVPVPAAACRHEGLMTVVVSGFLVENDAIVQRVKSSTATFRVLPSWNEEEDDGSVNATLAEALQAGIDNLKPFFVEKKNETVAAKEAAEAAQTAAETAQGKAEDAQDAAEAAQSAAETAQGKAEDAQTAAEAAQSAAETAQGKAEDAQTAAEAAQSAAETAQGKAEDAQDAAEAAQTAAETAQGKAEDAQDAAEAAQSGAVAAKAAVLDALMNYLQRFELDSQGKDGFIVVLAEGGKDLAVSAHTFGTSEGDVPVLGSGGKLPNSVLPPLAIGELITNTPGTKANLVNLSTAEKGDISTVTSGDVNDRGVYWLKGDYATLSNWIQIVGPSAVISVAGKSGEVTLGISDIQNLSTTLAAKAAKVASATEDDLASLTSDGDLADSGIPKDKVARVDGSYDLFTSGLSKNLQGRANSAVSANFTFRPSGGSADIGNPQATVKSIHGNTLVWNQLINKATYESAKTVNGITFTPNADGSITINGTSTGAAQYNIFTNAPAEMAITSHKYLLTGGFASGQSILLRFSGVAGNIQTSGDPVIATGNEANYLGRPMYIIVGQGNTYSNLKVYPQFFDLTKTYGSGNEPTTVAPFKALFSLPYYAYNAGALLHFNGTGLKTVGFNQWDGTATDGVAMSTQSGGTYPSASSFATGYIKVVSDENYYLNPTNWENWVCFYNAGKTYVGYGAPNAQNLVKIPSTAAYAKLTGKLSKKATACFNLSHSGYRNGEYEPYWTSTLSLPVTTYFPTGMKSAESVYDELTEKKAAQRIDVVDLGTLNWTYDASGYWEAPFSMAKLPSSSEIKGNILHPVYENRKASGFSATGNNGIALPATTVLRCKTTSNTERPSGILAYEMVTPIETDVDLNFTYKVDDYGTEQLLPENTSTPTTSPFDGTIHYAMNAVDKLHRLPDVPSTTGYYTVYYNASTGLCSFVAEGSRVYQHDIYMKNSDDERLYFTCVNKNPTVTYGREVLTDVPDGTYAARTEEHGAGVAVVSSGAVTFYYGTSSKLWDAEHSFIDTATKIY